MRVNCREQIANPAEPVNGQDERRKCAAIPRSRSITHPQATDFAQQNRPLQKENTILTDGVSLSKKPVIASQSADWRGNPFPKCIIPALFHRFPAKRLRIPTPVTSVTGSE